MELNKWMEREKLPISGLVVELAKSGAKVHPNSIRRFLAGEAYLHPKNEKAIVALTKGKVGFSDLRPYIRGGKGKAA